MFLSLVIKYYYRCVVPMTVVHGLNVWIFLTSCVLFLYLMCFYKRLILVLSDTLSNIYILSISHMGGSGNNLILGEDGREGASRLLGVSGSYWSHAHTSLLYDANGHLIKGTHLVNSSEASRTAVVQLPGNSDVYGLLSRDEAGALHYYEADLNEVGYGTPEAPKGEVHSVQVFSDRYYGRHMAVLENHAANRVRIYVTAHEAAAHQSTLYTIDIEEGRVYAPEPVLSYASHDREGDGELQIAPDGRKLYIYNHGKNLGFFAHREAEVLSFQLNASGNVLRADSIYTLAYGNKEKGSLEPGHTSEWLYVSRTGLVNYAGSGQDRHRSVYRIPVAGSHTESVSEVASVSGDSRLRYSDSLYVTAGGEEHLLRVHEGLFGNTVQQTILSHRFTGYQSMQPHRVYDREVLELVALRSVGDKSYELTDHLGNVKAVVSDRKKWSDAPVHTVFKSGYEGTDFHVWNDRGDYSARMSPEYSYMGGHSLKLRYDEPAGVFQGPEYKIAVEPGDTIDLEVYTLWSGGPGTKPGAIDFKIVDGQGQHYNFMRTTQGSPTPEVWYKSTISNFVVFPKPSGVDQLYLIIRPAVYSNEYITWFDNLRLQIRGGQSVPQLSAEVLSANSYYAFGSLMPKRSFNSSGYRYGFNGQEKDDEIKGSGNSYDFGARIYDPRIAKFLSPDPITKYYPSWSPYLFAGNNPIKFIDIYGMGPGDGTLTLESKDKEDIVTEKTVNTSSTTYSLSSSDQDYQKAYGKGLQNDVFKSNNLMINNSQPHAKMTVATTTTKVTYAEDGKTVIGTTTSQQVETRTMVQYDFYQVHSATGKDIYVGSVGDPMKTTSQDVANPAVSSVMSSFSNLITDYRAKTGISYTNVDEYAQDIMRQKSVVEAFDTYSPVGGVVIGALAKLRYGSAPSLAFGIATTGLQSSLERGLQTLEGKSNACQGCIKTYNIRNNGISKTPGYSK